MPLLPLISYLRGRVVVPGTEAAGTIISWDRDFLNGLDHVVGIEYDANAPGATGSGGDNDGDGDRAEDWNPVIGLESVRCHLLIRRPKNIEAGDRPTTKMEWKCMFGQSIGIDRRHRMVYRDGDDGSLRYGYVEGKAVNAHGENHHWTVTAIENPV